MPRTEHGASLRTIGERVRTREISPVEIVNACLTRIEKLNPRLNAFITVLADQAREEAGAAASQIRQGRWRGPLHGIPVGVKDFYDTAGIRTTGAFERFKDRVPAKDAAAVARLKEAGVIIIGKTNMHMLGMGTTSMISHFGPVHNPWNSEYIAGGSSGGSAAAVATGMCYATLDTDAVGSCRLPAACCGVVGLKGTYGLISTQGILEGEEGADDTIRWLSHAGITARNVEDAAQVLSVLAERSEQKNVPDNSAMLVTARKYRIGVANNFTADPEVTAAFQGAVAVISDIGHPISAVAAPFVNFSRGIGDIETDRKTIAAGVFGNVDLLLLPTTATMIPKMSDAGANPLALSPENTMFANYYGLPAISVPCGFDSHGLPLGLQIVGRPWDEIAVLQAALQYQNATGWHRELPTEARSER